MSASNWATCPRCLAAANVEYAARHAEVMASYGVVPPEEFDAAREALEPVDEEVYRTFREDYEFSGAETGEVTAFYGGECSSCGLSAELRATKRFWSGDETVNE